MARINEAFAVQALYCLDRLGVADDDPRVNIWGGALVQGHPLAASGPRRVAFLAGLFREKPEVRCGLATLCADRGQSCSMIRERFNRYRPTAGGVACR